jgi:hypothetical protein
MVDNKLADVRYALNHMVSPGLYDDLSNWKYSFSCGYCLSSLVSNESKTCAFRWEQVKNRIAKKLVLNNSPHFILVVIRLVLKDK